MTDDEWMPYVDAEVRAACQSAGMAYQLRRKWSVRHVPVSESSLADYEWKLIPQAEGRRPDAAPTEFDEGVYYVLSCDPEEGSLVFQHDTLHCGLPAMHGSVSTYSRIEIPPPQLWAVLEPGAARRSEGLPPDGWLSGHLGELTRRFDPNCFSLT